MYKNQINMNEQQIKETIAKVLKAIAPEARLDEIDPDDNMREAIDLDSMDFLNLLIGLHKEIGIEIPESDYKQLLTLSDMIHYLNENLKVKSQ